MANDGYSIGDEEKCESLECVKGGLPKDGSDGWMRETFNDFVCGYHGSLLSEFGMVT